MQSLSIFKSQLILAAFISTVFQFNLSESYSIDGNTNARKRTRKNSNRRPNYQTIQPIESNIEVPQSLTNARSQNPLNCPHFNDCPGCITKTKYDDVPTIQSAKLFFAKYSRSNDEEERRNFYKIVIPSDIHHYRTQAKLVVRSKSTWGRNGCIFGLYERNSHDVVEIPNCVIHHPSINKAVDVLSKATAEVGTVGYNEENHDSRGLRYVQLQVERKTGRVCMTLIWNGEDLKACQPDLSRLIKACKRIDGSLFHSIWCHTNNSYGNSIFVRGEKNWHPMGGPEFVREILPGTSQIEIKNRQGGLLHFNPMVFRQGNMDGFDAIAMHVAKIIPGGSKVCELYAGIGVLGLTALSYHGKGDDSGLDDEEWYDNDKNSQHREALVWLRCSDENPSNPRCFQRTVSTMPSQITGRTMSKGNNGKTGKASKRNKGNSSKGEKTIEDLMNDLIAGDSHKQTEMNPRKGKVSYMVASAAKALHEGQALGADVILVDPPRKGLEEEVLTQLCKPHNPNQDYAEDPMFLNGPRHSINWTNDAHTLIYVSCGFDALARDSDRLLKGNAGWRLESATGYVLFPGSNHVETVAVFKRRAGTQIM